MGWSNNQNIQFVHIIIKNKILSYGNYKVKCAVGKRGIGIKLKEGDLITPKGIYKIAKIFLRKDRIKNFRTKIKTFPIKKIWDGVMIRILRIIISL